MDLGAKLSESMKSHDVFSINLFGYSIPIADTIILMWIVMAFLIIFSIIFTRKLKLIPEGKQNFVETIVEFVNNFTKNILGHHWKHFAPYIGTILLFLVVANTISIFSILPTGEQLYHLTGIKFFEHLPEFEIRPPTKDINLTACMAIMSILLVLFSGIRFKGIRGWLKGFVHPTPIALPFHILDYFMRPFSLALRLFGNILGAFIIMELIYAAIPILAPAAFSIYFDLFDGILQAYIFVFLTTIYISEAVE